MPFEIHFSVKQFRERVFVALGLSRRKIPPRFLVLFQRLRSNYVDITFFEMFRKKISPRCVSARKFSLTEYYVNKFNYILELTTMGQVVVNAKLWEPQLCPSKLRLCVKSPKYFTKSPLAHSLIRRLGYVLIENSEL